jgi:hypothetical protein
LESKLPQGFHGALHAEGDKYLLPFLQNRQEIIKQVRMLLAEKGENIYSDTMRTRDMKTAG